MLWIVNEFGQATYVVGRLPNYDESAQKNRDPFSLLGHFLIKTFSTIIPYTLPYPYPQSKTPEIALIRQAINGRTFQQYRMNRDNQPISLMSATPLRLQNKIIGAAVLEQTMDSLLSESLNYFYRLIGIGGVVFLLVILGAIFTPPPSPIALFAWIRTLATPSITTARSTSFPSRIRAFAGIMTNCPICATTFTKCSRNCHPMNVI